MVYDVSYHQETKKELSDEGEVRHYSVWHATGIAGHKDSDS
jgi:hypothetical protein